LAAKHDYESFAKDELAARRARGYPPFGRLARIIVRSKSRSKAAEGIRQVAERLAEPARIAGLTILGPQPCPVAKHSRYWRYHLLLKARSAKALLHLWDSVRADLTVPSGVELAIDVDPQSTL